MNAKTTRWYEIDLARTPLENNSNRFLQLTDRFNAKYGSYDYTNDLRSILNNKFENTLKKIINFEISDTDNILIIGSNSSDEPSYFAPAKITALDISDKALKKLQLKYPEITIQHGDICDLPFKENTFDLVVCFRAIQSFAVEEEDAIAEMIRVLKPMKKGILSIPNGYYDNTTQEIIKGMYDPANKILSTTKPFLIAKRIQHKLSDSCRSVSSLYDMHSEIGIHFDK